MISKEAAFKPKIKELFQELIDKYEDIFNRRMMTKPDHEVRAEPMSITTQRVLYYVIVSKGNLCSR